MHAVSYKGCTDIMIKASTKSALFLYAAFAWLIVCAGVSPVCAQKLQFPPATGHVNDLAKLLDAGTKQQLETMLLNFEQRTGAQIAVATVPSLQGREVEDYANELYRAWGIGAKSGEHKDKGALLLIAPNERKSRLEVGYGLEGDLPDGLAGEMVRRMRPDFQQQRWAQGITIGVNTLVATLAQKWNVSLEGIDQQYAYAPAPAAGGAPGFGLVCFFIAFILFILLLVAIARRGGGGGGRGRRAGWYAAPIVFNSGGGDFGSGSSGGSWGGGSSGGSSWGGFGGGSSGGGGASDSW
jgi:uncharacterized protein